MLGRIATYVVPALSVAVTAAVLLGPGATRKAAFVRVYGAPWEGTSALALRIEAAERLYGIDEKASFQDVLVEAVDEHNAFAPVRVTLDGYGIGEAHIASSDPIRTNVMIRVRRGGDLLGVGPIELPRADAPARASIAPLRLPGQTSGNIKLDVRVRRGSLAAPFPDVLEVEAGLAEHVSPTNSSFKDIALEASAPGASLEPQKFVTDDDGRASITVTPEAHHIEMTITARHEVHGAGKWVGTLPVIPGAIWLRSKTKRELEFVSPVPRERIYVSLMNENGRIFGAIVPVSPDEQQTYRGRLTLSDFVDEVSTHVIVAGDPREQGSGTVAWPLRSGEVNTSRTRFACLLDGASAAEVRERDRARRVRNIALLVVIATTIFEVLYMMLKSRQSQRRLEEGLIKFAEGEPSPDGVEPLPANKRADVLASARQENRVLRVAVAISLVLVAFSMIGALSTLQW